MVDLTYRPRFTADLDEIYDYYAQYSEERATDLILRPEQTPAKAAQSSTAASPEYESW